MNGRSLEDFMNRLTDQDWGWWPFVFLRPPKDKAMDNVLLVKMSFSFGSMLGLAYLVIWFVAFHQLTLLSVALCFAGGWIVFFLGYKFTFACFWNRRARRLRDERRIV